ncbi:MAG: precorrin-3B synthase [Rhodovulum sulfidophilum]|uniref:Precorrin-3B synthase n=1 Tax=Rhodovulum sulfidophilum TaxID=35806 RepID=A0A2W5NG13_RHOSU|nr:MAG: precorrin-3B synthase [Rhodovulum sulfidophilum]
MIPAARTPRSEPGPRVRGWCPGALRPMESGDGWIVRLRPALGRLSPDQARGVARLARTHGNGQLDLSARANPQIRGVTRESHAPLIEGLRAFGLVAASVEAEARRTVMLTPFATAADDALARALEAALAEGPELPSKFGFAVDTGPRPVLTGTPADIRLERSARGALILRADGMALGAAVTEAEAPARAVALARWFLASGGVSGGRGRMAAHVARGAVPPGANDVTPAAPLGPPAPGSHPMGLLAAFAFGALDAETLAALAETGAELRLTPWRMLLAVGLDAAPAIPGLVTDPADPLLRVAACVGAPACPSGFAATRPLARALAPRVPSGSFLHVSGCAKGCAHPKAAPLTLVAGGEGFAAVRNGSAAGRPETPPRPAAAIAADPGPLIETP